MINMPQFLIITGMSGAGKTQAIRVFEDLGYYCIDNLPPALLSKFAKLCVYNHQVTNVALVMDTRGGEFFDDLVEELATLDDLSINYVILFLEATTDVLVRRYKETRRPHPLAGVYDRIIDAIDEEKKMLEELRGRANKIIDTSDLSSQDLKAEILNNFGIQAHQETITITAMSFGFKYGIPLDADMVIDVRFLPNPHYVPSLKKLTGVNPMVQDYVLKWPIAEKFLDKFFDLINFLVPNYIKEGKTHLTIAIGCTGGKHRSVTLTEKLAEFLKGRECKIIIDHRDIDRE